MNILQTKFKEKSTVLESLDLKGKKKVAVLAGGMSAERDVSLQTGQNIVQALKELGHNVISIDPGADLSDVLSHIKPDVVFNALHGTYGEDGCIQGLLNMMQIPYTHSGVLASSVAMNKLQTRRILDHLHQILFPKFYIVHKNDNLKNDPIPRPYVIKPLSQGSSIGINIIHSEDDFNFTKYNFPYGNELIVEEYIKGREINIAVLNGKALGILEIVVTKGEFYDYTAKYSNGYTKHVEPHDLTKEEKNHVLKLSEDIYQTLGCNGITRVEFLYKEGKFYFLEINTHPGMTNLSLCPEIAMQSGINFNSLVEQILDSAKYE
ncbi:D-alanine--D-alanine ligase [Candidatus Phycorickettsia trachydisci]|uniref:D-alanine--D-alanine ligase n=1 Tax=Candidatus Phycorickettsia trachydisci TaxID=2115978 RepID=A0A2P1P7V1_9RICK|nr:D-alanine--D-alanine ligase [Candidatus Phycorickettsia trachydisci]AVP87348.1 D-alanine--D-alanine ligase [Candidatus Phycorickettsia trachydisci]